jgi:hypothetical protein
MLALALVYLPLKRPGGTPIPDGRVRARLYFAAAGQVSQPFGCVTKWRM